MAYVTKTSVADGVPFDPNLPSVNPADRGYSMGFNPTSGLWYADSSTSYHQNSPLITSTAISLNGTLTLTNSSNSVHFLTGSGANYSIVLPAANTLSPGWKFEIWNTTNELINIKDGSGALLFQLAQQSLATIQMQTDSTIAGVWKWWQILASSTASGIINYNLVSNTPFVTTSLTDVIITGFTVTPQAGIYAVWYNASVLYNTTPKSHWWSIYKDGVKITDSERLQDTAHSNQVMVDSTMTVVSVNGSQALDIRVRCSSSSPTAGQLTVNGRTLLAIRLGT